MYWLLETSVLKNLEAFFSAGIVPSAEQQAEFAAMLDETEDSHDSRILTIAGDVAQVEIKGVITKGRSFMAMLFGGGNVTYSEIISALAQADKNPEIKKIVMAIDSPGGEFDGLFDALAAIEATTKPTHSVISNVGASAAYALASQADSIEASNIAARIGSVGIAASFDINENAVTLTSTEAPKKRPDVSTKAGRAVVVAELDGIHEIFVDAIAGGRKVTSEKVNASYGQGATLLAKEALKRGMIDGIAKTQLHAVDTNNNSEIGTMDLATFKAEHPEVFAAAVKLGTTDERDRIQAHLTMGEASGDMKTALEAIKDGSLMTAALQAAYMAAGMNRNDSDDRLTDEQIAAAAASAAAGGGDEDSEADTVLSAVQNQLGISAEA